MRFEIQTTVTIPVNVIRDITDGDIETHGSTVRAMEAVVEAHLNNVLRGDHSVVTGAIENVRVDSFAAI